MTTTESHLRYIDSDGHILEPPTAMPDYAPAEYRDRIWHIETDSDGTEWSCTTTETSVRPTSWRPPAPRDCPTRIGRVPSAGSCATPRPALRRGTPKPA